MCLAVSKRFSMRDKKSNLTEGCGPKVNALSKVNRGPNLDISALKNIVLCCKMLKMDCNLTHFNVLD